MSVVTEAPPSPPTDDDPKGTPSIARAGDATANLARELLAQHRAAEQEESAEFERKRALARSRTMRKLAELARDLPHADDDPTIPPWEDVAAHQAHMRARAWGQSLRAGLFDKLAHWRLDAVDDEPAMVARAWLRSLGPGCRKLNLIVAGTVGAGKTSIGIAVGNEAAANGMTVRIVSHEQYVTMLRPGQGPDGMSEALVESRYRRHTDLLILDDLAAEMEDGASDHVAKKTVALLGDRANAGLPTLITTNLTSDQVRAVLGDRSYSRLAGTAHVIRMVGEDRREPVEW